MPQPQLSKVKWLEPGDRFSTDAVPGQHVVEAVDHDPRGMSQIVTTDRRHMIFQGERRCLVYPNPHPSEG